MSLPHLQAGARHSQPPTPAEACRRWKTIWALDLGKATYPPALPSAEQALNAAIQADGDQVFLIQRDVDPAQLSLTIDDGSLVLRRR